MSLPPAILQSSPTPSAAKVLALIESEEGEYQTSLAETYRDMSERTYKSLRRALPMTRSKMDWDKVPGGFIRLYSKLIDIRCSDINSGPSFPLEKVVSRDLVDTNVLLE